VTSTSSSRTPRSSSPAIACNLLAEANTLQPLAANAFASSYPIPPLEHPVMRHTNG
jgi:hypothetical protein